MAFKRSRCLSFHQGRSVSGSAWAHSLASLLSDYDMTPHHTPAISGPTTLAFSALRSSTVLAPRLRAMVFVSLCRWKKKEKKERELELIYVPDIVLLQPQAIPVLWIYERQRWGPHTICSRFTKADSPRAPQIFHLVPTLPADSKYCPRLHKPQSSD